MSDKEIKYKITADAAQAERAIKQLAKKLKQVGDLTDVLMGGAASSSSTSTSLNATRSTAHGAHQTTAAGVGSGGSTSDHLAGSTSTARRVWDRLPPSWQNAMASGVRGASQIMDASHEGGYGQSAYARNMQGRITGHGEHVMRSAYAPIRAGNAAAGAQFTGNMVSNTTRSIGQGMQSLAENSAIFGPMGVALGLGGVAAGIGFELAGQGLQLRHDDLRELATMERYEAQAGAARGNGQRVGRWVDGSAVKTGAKMLKAAANAITIATVRPVLAFW
mgnify:FL=1